MKYHMPTIKFLHGDYVDTPLLCRACNVAQVLRTRVETLPRTDIANWVKVIFQGTPQTYATKIAAQLNHGRVRMEYNTVAGHVKKLQQTGVYKDLKLVSKEECKWDENVNAIQKEVAVFNDHRATVHEAQVRSDTAQQWDPSCDVKQDKVCDNSSQVGFC